MTLLENVVVGMHRHLALRPGGAAVQPAGFRAQERRARERALRTARRGSSWTTRPKTWPTTCRTATSASSNSRARWPPNRKLLLLDEPVAGMNTGEKAELMREIQNIKARGYTIFMIEHDMRFVMGLCERIAVLNFGRIIAEGEPGRDPHQPAGDRSLSRREDDDDDAADATEVT